MKRFNRNEIRANDGESNIRPQSKGNFTQRHYTRAGAAIFAIIILHFVSQFIFFQDEKTSPRTEAINHRSVEIEPEIEPIAEFQTESVAKKPSPAAKMPKVAAPVVQPELKPAPAARVVIKKKEPRESRAERLRRAEKLLTGV